MERKEVVSYVCDFFLGIRISDELRETVLNIKLNASNDIYDKSCVEMLNCYLWEYCFENNRRFERTLKVYKEIRHELSL